MFRRKRNSTDFSAEVQAHIQMETERLRGQGLSDEAAHNAAHRSFGNSTKAQEQFYESSHWLWFDHLSQDIRFALRMLRKSPGFTAVAILTLALGIGASTAVFSLVNAVLLKPLPFPHAEQVAFPWKAIPAGQNLGYDKGPWGRVEFLFFSRESKPFAHLGAFQSDSFNLTGSGEPIRLNGLRASAGFFPALGVFPSLGRVFTDDEDQPGREHEVILSDSLWHERFAADPRILGRTLELNGAAYTIIGVVPPSFAFPRANEMPSSFTFAPNIQLWVPLALNRGPIIPAESDELAVVGRLAPGVTVAQAQTAMNLLGKRFAQERKVPAKYFTYDVTSLAQQVSGDIRAPLLLILLAVAVVLLIACANVASLLLTRSLARRRELSLRAALGARNSRLIRQLLTENVLLAGAGGVAGIILAQGGIYFAKHFGPASIPRLSETSLDFRVIAFAVGVSLLTGILFGLAPAISATRENFSESLKEGGHRAGSTRATHSLRHALVVSQIALALVLVVAAGLLTRTFYRLLSVDPGFHPGHVLTFETSLPATAYPDQQRIVTFYTEALRRLRNLPGVQAAGVTETIPMDGATEATVIRISGRVQTDIRDIPIANYTMVSPGYFAAAGTPILRGREFLPSDTAASTPVTIISEALAKKFWPGQDSIGKQMAPRSPIFPLATIVGVAADVKRLSLREAPPPEMYAPYTQKIWPSMQTMDVILRTSEALSSATVAARDVIHSVDPNVPIANVRTLSSIVADSMSAPRFSMLLIALFGAIAISLATIGMYGVISYSVAQRTQEIGLRMALGAQPRNVLELILGQGARLVIVGITIGLAAAFVATRLMNSFLYGVGALDPVTFLVVSLLLAGVALLACYIPARRATRVDPMIALRYE